MVALRDGDGTHKLGEGAVVAGGQWTVVGSSAHLWTLVVLVDGVHRGLWVGGCRSSWVIVMGACCGDCGGSRSVHHPSPRCCIVAPPLVATTSYHIS
jgi:hypothetical protein